MTRAEDEPSSSTQASHPPYGTRDPLVGKEIYVCGSVYKGRFGEIKGTSANKVSVILESKLGEIVYIDKKHVVLRYVTCFPSRAGWTDQLMLHAAKLANVLTVQRWVRTG